jgi:hypothetical protein
VKTFLSCFVAAACGAQFLRAAPPVQSPCTSIIRARSFKASDAARLSTRAHHSRPHGGWWRTAQYLAITSDAPVTFTLGGNFSFAASR